MKWIVSTTKDGTLLFQVEGDDVTDTAQDLHDGFVELQTAFGMKPEEAPTRRVGGPDAQRSHFEVEP